MCVVCVRGVCVVCASGVCVCGVCVVCVCGVCGAIEGSPNCKVGQCKED